MVRHPFAEAPLQFKKMYLWQPDYMEFICSRETFQWLAFEGGLTHMDGVPVTLQIMDTIVGGHNVIAKIWPVYGDTA